MTISIIAPLLLSLLSSSGYIFDVSSALWMLHLPIILLPTCTITHNSKYPLNTFKTGLGHTGIGVVMLFLFICLFLLVTNGLNVAVGAIC